MATPDSKPHFGHSHSHSHSHSLSAADLKHLTTPTATAKNAKGKQKEQDNWQFGWWDYAPLLEGHKPPVQWTSSSIILTAHATEPRVVCLHYPSNNQFTLHPPPPLLKTPAQYEPPRVITVAAQDVWVFAYFPGINIDGVCCVWKRGAALDHWVVRDWWTLARGSGVVTARWLNPGREWTSSENGVPVRLPTLGPYMPDAKPVLFYITEAHLCTVYYVNPQTDKMQMLNVSLSRKSKAQEGEEHQAGERIDGPRGLGRVTHAAIGFMYDESCFLVATRSTYTPTSIPEQMKSNSVDLTMPLNIPPAVPEPAVSSDWEAWRDENTIEICEISVSTAGSALSIKSKPLSSIINVPSQTSYVTGLTFVPGLPSVQSSLLSTPTLGHHNVTPQSSPAMTHASVMQSPGRAAQKFVPKGSPPKPGIEKLRGKTRSVLYLLCSTVDVGQYSTPPKSDIAAFLYARSTDANIPWVSKRRAPLTLQSTIVVDLASCQFSNSSQHASVLLATLSTEGPIVKHKDRRTVIAGKLSMLRLPEFQSDESWEPTIIECPIDSFGVISPCSFAVSPNRTLVCAVSSLSFSSPASRITIHPHPVQTHYAQELGPQRMKKQLSSSLTVALHKKATSSDIAHILSLRSTPLHVVEDVLSNSLVEDDINGNGLTNLWTNDLIGAAVEVYRMRSEALSPGIEKDELLVRSTIGQELCSFYACTRAWEDMEVGEGYDLDAVWYLTGLCGYFIEFMQSLLKECVLFASCEDLPSVPSQSVASNVPKSPSFVKTEKQDDDPFAIPRQTRSNRELPSPISPVFLYLTHPYAFRLLHNFLRHVCRFRAFLRRLTAKGDNARMVKDVLSDIVDNSEIDLEALEKVSHDISAAIKQFIERNTDLTTKYIATLTPPIQCLGLLRDMIGKIMQAQVVDKARLFIKPDDLVDGLLGLSLASAKKLDRDVVSKGFLASGHSVTCVRCNGRSEPTFNATLQMQMANPWLLWEKSWQDRCVCGGLWMSK